MGGPSRRDTPQHPGLGRHHSSDVTVDAGYVDPDYWRLLKYNGGTVVDGVEGLEAPSSPIQRLVEMGGEGWPGLRRGEPAASGRATSESDGQDDAAGREVEIDLDEVNGGKRIAMDAFSPNYFRRFFVEERELGRGGKGVVLLVRHQLDGVPLGMCSLILSPIACLSMFLSRLSWDHFILYKNTLGKQQFLNWFQNARYLESCSIYLFCHFVTYVEPVNTERVS